MNREGYFSDQRLLLRVKDYLVDTRGNTTSAHHIADQLKFKYREYERRKSNAFVKLIERAIVILSNREGSNITPSAAKKRKHEDRIQDISDSESFSSDIEDYANYQDSNSMNTMMSKMYKKPVGKKSSYSELSNRTYSTSNSPKRVEIGSQAPSLGRSLFTIDKTGNKKLKSMINKVENTKSQESRLDKRYIMEKNDDVMVVKLDDDDDDDEDEEPKRARVDIECTARARADADNTSALSSPRSMDVIDIDPESEEAPSSVKAKRGKIKKPIEKLKKKKVVEVQQSTVTFANIGGNEETLKEICKLLVHLKHPEIYRQLGVTPPRGFLLHGPPGCGKTLLAHAIAGELQLPFIKLAATEIVSGVSGESEEKIRDIYEQAVMASPCILFMDEIDAITQKRETASKDMERRIVAQLLTCMDELNAKPEAQVIVVGATNRAESLDPALRRAGRFDREICMGIPNEAARMGILKVLCAGLRLSEDFELLQLARATPGFVGADLMALAREAAIFAVNRVFAKAQILPNSIQAEFKEAESLKTLNKDETMIPKIVNATTSAGSTNENLEVVVELDISQDDSLIEMDSPKRDEDVLKIKDSTNIENEKCDKQKVASDEKMNVIKQPDSELSTVLDWLRDTPPLTDAQLADLYITMADFKHACKVVQPSAKREGFATIPDVTWSDIGALAEVREELNMAILAPVRHPEQFLALGITSPAGVLLAGPPGCGKTLLAKAVASESGLNFISVKGPELLNMYVGESERAVRQVFARARNSAPCVIFFDELDALCPKRSGSAEGNSSARVVNQLLTEMDGLEERKHVFIMGATNRPDIVDPAVLRPGRLDKIIYVGLPTPDDRLDILMTLTKKGTKPALNDDVKLEEIAKDLKCKSYTGADLAALVREASVLALREYMGGDKYDPSHVVLVARRHFDSAMDKIKPSVSDKDQEKYERMRHQFTLVKK